MDVGSTTSTTENLNSSAGKPKGKKLHFGLTCTYLNVWITVACMTAMTLSGYDQGVFGGIIVTPDFLRTTGNPDPGLQGTIVSLYDIGCFLGAMSAFVIGVQLGRKTIWYRTIGAILQTSAFSLIQMIVARLITGSIQQRHPSGRARRRSLRFTEGSVTWRFPITFQLVFSFILLGTVPWLPESPRWLLAHSFKEEGIDVLIALEGDHATARDDIIVRQKEENLEAVRLEKEHTPSWRDVLRGRTGDTGMIKRLALGAGTQWMQQLAGINVTSYYLPLVLQNSGVPWLYPTEINVLSMRTKGAALATASNWISNYIVVQITPIGIANLDWCFYLIWMASNAVFVPLVWLLYPEAANRHLEDIDKVYRENKGMVFVFHKRGVTQVERPKTLDADLPHSSEAGSTKRSEDRIIMQL
ncbi:hypothetical protein AX15_003614 [Amanita polypyramis BW_CC]|nr:hypothetical protein AX15_003614 [Amanita polypyramis BW_CC]